MEISPGNVSDRKWPLPKIFKIKNSHDAKQLFRGSSLEIARSLGHARSPETLHNYRILSVKNHRERARIANLGMRFCDQTLSRASLGQESDLGGRGSSRFCVQN